MTTLRRSLLAAACTGLASMLALHPVAVAADCVAPPAMFTPGRWEGHASYLAAHDDRFDSDLYASRVVNFTLDVNPQGRADGKLALQAGGVQDGRGLLEISSVASWSVDAELSGVATHIQADGTFRMDMEGIIAVSGEDDIFLGGKQYMGHEASIEKETSFDFAPYYSTCAYAVGDFGDNFEVTDEDETFPLTWVAFRHGGKKTNENIHRRYNDLVGLSMQLLDQDRVEVGQLTDLVVGLIGLNSILAQPDHCSSAPEELRPGTHANAIARDLLGAALTHVMAAALEGEYSTDEVVTIVTLGLQAAALDVNRCGVDQDQAYAERAQIMGMFETALELRLDAARENGDQDEIDRILAAAYQFGLYGLLEA